MQINLLSSVTATTTGSVFDVSNLENLSLQVSAAGVASGNGVFKLQVSIDGQSWIDYNMLIDNLTNTNGQQVVRVASSTLNSITSKIYGVDQASVPFKLVRGVCTVTTDGSYSATLFGNVKTGS